ncbi:alpha amylase C-terminal domain-containing protein [Natronosporangium hydrolyticum]|uniref:Alpha-amylase n=1 Tax=Natronosporangium hydrolyticum TaxID=2811111 RepID=A0A895Y9I8_9ACTN|nr:carbohydrate-binding module family 20 domain-containing protein [Natronosporangium hydrolyticum]QSB12932.1 alpha amylase C-terminal domain-containing protein [Natronosporangium hydrolyticum]
MRLRRFLAAGAALAVTTAAATLPPTAGPVLAAATPAASQTATAADSSVGGTIVHLFQWRWESVAQECADVLGPAGYHAVQVSPPQEHVVLPDENHPWWQDYQPVSYRLDNTRRGTRADFIDMVETCRDHGVQIYVDAVINHMTGTGSIGSGPGSAGGQFSKYEYPEVPYSDSDFSDCRRDIANWDDPDEVWHCELLALSDLRTSTAHVQQQLADFLNDMIAIGVAGFRVDAAKHMPPADLAAIYGMLDPVPGTGEQPYIFQEVIEGGGPDSLRPPAYAGLGDVTEFRYHRQVGAQLRDGQLSGALNALPGQMSLPAHQAVVFIDNHDTQREDPSISYQGMGSAHDVAQAFMLAHPYGTPKVMSSYPFTSTIQGPPSTGTAPGNPAGELTAATDCGSGDWFCEHRNPAVAGLVGFRNQVGDAPIADVWTGNGGAAAGFSRGDLGYAVFNRGGVLNGQTFQTGLPAGSYCNVASGSRSDGDGGCTGAAYQVAADGSFQANLGGDSVIALHRGETGSGDPGNGDDPEPPAGCEFAVTAETWWGQQVHVVGDLAALGGWQPANGPAMSSADYPIWRTEVALPTGASFEYKYIKRNPDGGVEWESGDNRSGTAGPGCSFQDNWRG